MKQVLFIALLLLAGCADIPCSLVHDAPLPADAVDRLDCQIRRGYARAAEQGMTIPPPSPTTTSPSLPPSGGIWSIPNGLHGFYGVDDDGTVFLGPPLPR